MAEVLIIDDDKQMCLALAWMIEGLEHHVEYALSIENGLEKANTKPFDAVFLDVNMPDGCGLDVLNRIRKVPTQPEVIIITGNGDPDGAEIAIKNGAWDYLQKPLSAKQIELPLTRVLQYRRNHRDNFKPPVVLKRDGIIGNSHEINSCLETLASAAESTANVLFTGDTGTGKEIFAKALHENSPRAERNFVVVDCGALPETLIESSLFGYEKGAFTGANKSKEGLIRQADQGTLFLDEVCELSLPLQKAFLRVLQERRYRPIGGQKEVKSDFRLVAATNRNPEDMVKKGLFRKDLLYRLQSISIHLPPLSERSGDITELIVHYSDKISTRYGIKPKGFSPDFIDLFNSYDWPGNVRELVNTLESAINQARYEPILFPRHLPEHIRIQVARASVVSNISLKDKTIPLEEQNMPDFNPTSDTPPTYREFCNAVLADAGKEYFRNLMQNTGGKIKEACRVSNLGRTRLYTLLKEHNISSTN